MEEKEAMFLIFAAGYEAGMNKEKGLAKAFSEWYEALMNLKGGAE